MASKDDISPPQWVPENPLAGAEDDTTRIAPPLERDLEVGDVLKGRFELVEALGAGGMGTVFKACDRLRVEAKDRQPYVAVKVVGRAFQRHQISFQAFQREAKRAQSLAHPNIVRVHDFDRDGPHVFITMEYLSGRPLDKIIRSRPPGEIALKEALKVLEPICSALSFAHDNGIVHCDIKPSNIFVTDEGMVKVIDFGIARAVKRPDGEQTVFDGGTLKAATLAYASPELQAGDAEPSPCDDVYSLACLAYELLTGRHPFDRLPAGSALARQREPARPEGLTKTQWAGLRRALAFERERRTPTVRQLLADLQAGDGRRRPRWPMAAAAAAAVLALAVVGTLVLWEEGGEERAPPPAVREPQATVCLPQGPIDFATLKRMQDCPGDQLYQTAQRLIAEDDADTALPLVRTAANKGHGPSALLLGEWYDPLQRDDKRSPILDPDRARALEWYEKAEAYGEETAGERLRALMASPVEQDPPALIAPSPALAPSAPAALAGPPRPAPEPPPAPAEEPAMHPVEPAAKQAAPIAPTQLKPAPQPPRASFERDQPAVRAPSGPGARCGDIQHRLQLGEILSERDRTYLLEECGR